MADTGDLGAMAHPGHRQTDKERRQGGVAADQIIPLPTDFLSQNPGGVKIFSGRHAFFEGDMYYMVRLWNFQLFSAAGYIHPPAQPAEFRQISPVKVDDVRAGGGRKQHLSFHKNSNPIFHLKSTAL